MTTRRDVLTGLACASTASLLPARAFADPGVMADKIILGQAAVFEGPASALGLGMRDGLTAAFAEANAKGGVAGRKIELLTQDDGYEPGKSIEATKALIAKDVFALVGPVGTPTSMAAHPIAKEAGLPFIGAFTGAEKARLGALRSAHGGSLFLDEVADIPAAAQVKLLRSLESGEVKPLGSDEAERADFRLISATSQNIDERVESGAFRIDLYFRIAGHVVYVPPLRERPLDILAMARQWLAEAELGLDSEAEAKLLSYRWPGNVRELKASLERARVHAQAEGSANVLSRHLAKLASGPVRVDASLSHRGRTLDEMEKECILGSLERNGWSRSAAATELGIARSTLFHKMKRFDLKDTAIVVGEGG